MKNTGLQQYETLSLDRLPILQSDTPEGWAGLWAEVKLLPSAPWPPEARPSVKPRRKNRRDWAAHIGRLLVGGNVVPDSGRSIGIDNRGGHINANWRFR